MILNWLDNFFVKIREKQGSKKKTYKVTSCGKVK